MLPSLPFFFHNGMKHQITYLLLEAFRGFRSDRFLSITSIITIGICNAVFASLLLAMSFVFSAGSRGEQDGVVRVFTKAQHEDSASLAKLERRLKGLSGIDSVVFVSKDDALMEFKRDFGEDMLQALEANPLPHAYWVYLSPENRSAAALQRMRDLARLFPEVEEATGETVYLAWLDQWKWPVQLGTGLLLLFVAGALGLIIHNAVKLNLYARRDLVENMKYCGAGEGFIVTPFLLEGVLLGIGGSLLGAGTLAFLIYLSRFLSPRIAAHVDFTTCALALVLSTALIAAITSVRTVRQFLLGHV
jgi:cell division transport system permease protein